MIHFNIPSVWKRNINTHTRGYYGDVTLSYGSVLPTFICANLHFSGLNKKSAYISH